MLGANAREYGGRGNNLCQFCIAHHTKLGTRDNRIIVGDAQVAGDIGCSQRMVASNHERADASRTASSYSCPHLWPRWIDHAHQPQIDQFLLYLGNALGEG